MTSPILPHSRTYSPEIEFDFRRRKGSKGERVRRRI